jgi:chromosome segregation ATPase
MTDTTTRLNNLKTQIDEGKAQKAKAEANLETYTKQLNDIKAEIRTLGVEPAEEALAAEIERLDAEIEANLSKAEELLNSPAVQVVE